MSNIKDFVKKETIKLINIELDSDTKINKKEMKNELQNEINDIIEQTKKQKKEIKTNKKKKKSIDDELEWKKKKQDFNSFTDNEKKQINYSALFSYLSEFKANTAIYNVYNATSLPFVRDFADRDIKFEDIKNIISTQIYSKMLGITPTHDPVLWEQYKLWKLIDPAMDAILYELKRI